jgi:hypothetical protein
MTYLVCHVWGIVDIPGGYSGSSWITRQCVTQVCSQLVADLARNKNKIGWINKKEQEIGKQSHCRSVIYHWAWSQNHFVD